MGCLVHAVWSHAGNNWHQFVKSVRRVFHWIIDKKCFIFLMFSVFLLLLQIGDYLREKYDEATQVKLNKRGHLQVKDSRYKVPTANDLVYLDESPDWCRNTKQLQWPGEKNKMKMFNWNFPPFSSKAQINTEFSHHFFFHSQEPIIVSVINHLQVWMAVQFFAVAVAIIRRKLWSKSDAIANSIGVATSNVTLVLE